MAIKSNFPDRLQVRLSSSVELIRASLEPYLAWIEEMVGVPLDQTLTLEVEADPGNAVAERLLPGLPLLAGTKARNRSWHSLIEAWTLPSGGSPRIAASFQPNCSGHSSAASLRLVLHLLHNQQQGRGVLAVNNQPVPRCLQYG